MITQKKVVEVLKNWNLDNEKVSDGDYEGTDNRNNHAFYIGNDYVLKFSANLGALKNHIDISKELDKMGFSAAVAIYTMHGHEFIQDGELYVCLSKRI